MLLRPLPYEAPERLVSLHERRAAWVGPLSAHELVASRERNRVFDSIGAYVYSQSTLTGTGEPATVQTLLTSWSLELGSALGFWSLELGI